MCKEVIALKQFKVYVTDLTLAKEALAEIGLNATINHTYLTIDCEESRKMEIILHLNKSRVVVYDIE